ncbi:NFACT RNA binding domain-containing protein [Reichenbachiella sp. MSK19-1]|uniref:NFACT RNA binding domain-containing protein n=1 Tax=Reichenbachiella sp. MSK19-1 TaxID=1897631 RepID=UPI000E6C9B00|nr:NFACT RNA binding domain-containing protein [Reichenbachiella sp. MSK19-1]RJE75141.1 hypothetical protein BGP76_18715 [Reichenbachiella sp. MSK19-1]
MQFNYYFLRFLSEDLKDHLIGKRLTTCFSQNKNELVLAFEDDQSTFYIKANLDGEASLLSFPEQFARAKRNSADLFEDIIDETVTGIRQYVNERCLTIGFGTYSLLFKLHGRRANVVLFHDEAYVAMFKNDLVADKQIDLIALDRPIDQSHEAIRAADFAWKSIFPTFDKNLKKYLESKGYHESADDEKLGLLDQLLDQLLDRTFYLYETEALPKMRLITDPSLGEVTVFTDTIAISNAYARAFFQEYHFNRDKERAIRQIEKELQKSQNYLEHTQTKIDAIEQGRKYDELANILMANLHVPLATEQRSITLFDFYTNQELEIKIKPKMSLQKNAEVYYRKSKNQNIELDTAIKNLRKKEKHALQLMKELEALKTTVNYRDLKKLLKDQSSAAQTNKVVVPFYSCMIDGFEVYLGKNARNNDLLTQKYAKKNDTWLHAKDVSGSHAIIRNPNNQIIAKHIIEEVAALAAWYSKRQHDTLCPVLYTQKKYVRKPKGSLPGQVMVDREQVVLVKPSRSLLEE